MPTARANTGDRLLMEHWLSEKIRTPLTDLLKITHPVMLAGMNVAAGPELAAAVTNAGGLGVIGGHGYTPDMLREQIAELKSFLKDPKAPFGVDLLLPQVGGNARKTKYIYLSRCHLIWANHLTATIIRRANSMSLSPSSLNRGRNCSSRPSECLRNLLLIVFTELVSFT